MRIFPLFVFCVIISAKLFAQESEAVKLDLLKAPVSPAANLLGFATSDIDKPTDLSAFMLSLQSATSSFTKLPSNYAIDVAPFLIGNKKSDLTTTGLQSTDFKDVFKQTFVLSGAIKTADSSETNFNSKSLYAGIGFKFSILRGDYDEETKNSLNKISDLQNKILAILKIAAKKYLKDNDPKIAALREKLKTLAKGKTPEELSAMVNDPESEYKKTEDIISVLADGKLTKLQLEVVEEENAESISKLTERIKKIASAFQTNRIGFTWDINAGLSGEFINKKFNDSRLYNAGVWQTFGYTDKKGSSFLGLARLLYNPDKIFAKNDSTNNIGNITTFDAGVRYVYSKPQSKFSCSMEGIYRSVLSSKTINPSWRLLFNADYSIAENKKLTFSFGRNFDGAITKDGNLIAALTLLTGFGNKR